LKSAYISSFIYVSKLVCTRWENFIRIGITVLVMVFNVTFKNISVISWRSVLLVEETDFPIENH